jgi:hypothetical protein
MTMFNTRKIMSAIQSNSTRAAKVRYKIEVAGCNNPWATLMRLYMQRLLGTYSLGAKTLDLLTAAWAKSTSDTYNNAIKPYFEFCEEQGLPPLAATAAAMPLWPSKSHGSGNVAPSRQLICNLTS